MSHRIVQALKQAGALLLLCASANLHAGSIEFSAATYTTNEVTTPAVLTLTRTGVATAASVLVTASNGTATVTSDYTAVSITVNWAANDVANKTVSIPILDDRVAEGSETVTVTLSAPTGDTLGAVSEVAETAGTAVIPVTRTIGSNGAVTIAYATSNGTATSPDFYTATSGVLTFADGVTTMNISVPIINNALGQANRDFRITLSTITGGALAGTLLTTAVTIRNDDADFTPGLTKITPVRTGVTQPVVLSLAQASPFLSTNTLLATVNRIPELSITGLVAVQEDTGITSIAVGDATYHFTPYTAVQMAPGTAQGDLPEYRLQRPHDHG